MAAVQLQTLHTMTLGQQTKMYNVLPHSPSQTNCVIVSTGIPHPGPMGKSVIQGKRPLAPAPERTSVLVTNGSDLRCKRKISFLPYGTPGSTQPASVARRNARERNRVKQVNNGFATLRSHIPSSVAAALASPGSNSSRGASKKLSKVETLKMAVEYIRSLQQLLDDHETEVSSNAPSDGMMDSRYYASSPESVAQQMSHSILMQQTPPCSEASTSPTPSFSSEGSVSVPSTYAPTVLNSYSQEYYEKYEPTSPEDEELLDAISWWQQQ